MTDIKTKLNIFGQNLDEITDLIVSLGHSKFRAKQIFNWIYLKSAKSFLEMSDLPKNLQEELEENYRIGSLALIERQESSDGTKKYLFALEDGSLVESVLMCFEGTERLTACISSQIGCAVKCPFCSTGTLGFKKNLRDDEILEQVQFIQNLEQERISNIVFMGQGEPLNNYDSVVSATQKLRQLIGIGARHITISTSGVIPQIEKLADEKIQLTLALSLHDPDDDDRDLLVPINKKWKIAPLIDSMKRYVNSTNRRVTIEYVLLKDLNDSDEKAKRLGQLVSNLHCNINLIPYNQSCSDTIFLRPDDSRINKFAELVKQHSKGKTVTVRQEKGHDIKAACGQLESSYREAVQSSS
ncbi:MAG: 23S rRNA (adenine(2503)-C(2))-methyltransferase RlmN [Candidatus Caenarcaniphilales bacterium]|nr:23S rRNA (adenine(2503)-C(2))-methyltransferase RlmN [Candidatus Caenarcaniphilales bacterium]